VGFVNLGLAAKDPYKTHQQKVFSLSHKKLQNELTFWFWLETLPASYFSSFPPHPSARKIKKKLKVDKYLVLAPHLAPFLVP
jgi:hypothetical protein